MAITIVAATAMVTVAGGAAWAQPNICVAANGEVRVEKGTALCDAERKGSVAVARGDGAAATAVGGERNTAVAVNGSFATASSASSNKAIATEGFSDGNTAIATSDGCDASATEGGATDRC